MHKHTSHTHIHNLKMSPKLESSITIVLANKGYTTPNKAWDTIKTDVQVTECFVAVTNHQGQGNTPRNAFIWAYYSRGKGLHGSRAEARRQSRGTVAGSRHGTGEGRKEGHRMTLGS